MLAGLSILLLVPLVVYRSQNARTPAEPGLRDRAFLRPGHLPGQSWLIRPVLVPYYVGLVLGMLGLISSFVHGVPGFESAKALGLIHTIVNTQETVTIEVINGLCWGIVYGALVMPAATGRVI